MFSKIRLHVNTGDTNQQTNEYRDTRCMYFRREVLDKYRNNDLCEIASEDISFLLYDKNTAASTVNFVNMHNLLMVQA
jgi:hypothetical protein